MLAKLNFLQPLLQNSILIFYLLLLILKTVFTDFCANCGTFYFSGFYDESSSNEQHLIEIEIYGHIINANNVHFDQFNTS